MADYGLVVVGSGPAGVSAASAYQQAGGAGPVLLVSADPHPPYERPPLSKQSLHAPTEPELTPLAQADALDGVEVRLGTRVAGLDVVGRTLRLGDETIRFDRIVLAPGAQPQPLPVADDDAEVHYLRQFTDLQRLHAAAGHARSAVVIGSGFIGCEAAVTLARRGLDVTLVTPEQVPQAARLGEQAGRLIAQLLESYGVHLRAGVEVTAVAAPRTVHLDDGQTLAPDLVLAAVGIAAATDFVQDSGLQLFEGRVVVDRHLRTATEGVHAAGDAAHAEHAVAGRPIPVEHWGDALAMGEVAGRSAAGLDAEWSDVPGFWTQLGEHTLQYAAWGDGYDELEVDERPGRLTVWYGRDGELAGVLAYNTDADYERGRELIAQRAPLAAGPRGDAPAPPPEQE